MQREGLHPPRLHVQGLDVGRIDTKPEACRSDRSRRRPLLRASPDVCGPGRGTCGPRPRPPPSGGRTDRRSRPGAPGRTTSSRASAIVASATSTPAAAARFIAEILPKVYSGMAPSSRMRHHAPHSPKSVTPYWASPRLAAIGLTLAVNSMVGNHDHQASLILASKTPRFSRAAATRGLCSSASAIHTSRVSGALSSVVSARMTGEDSRSTRARQPVWMKRFDIATFHESDLEV